MVIKSHGREKKKGFFGKKLGEKEKEKGKQRREKSWPFEVGSKRMKAALFWFLLAIERESRVLERAMKGAKRRQRFFLLDLSTGEREQMG